MSMILRLASDRSREKIRSKSAWQVDVMQVDVMKCGVGDDR